MLLSLLLACQLAAGGEVLFLPGPEGSLRPCRAGMVVVGLEVGGRVLPSASTPPEAPDGCLSRCRVEVVDRCEALNLVLGTVAPGDSVEAACMRLRQFPEVRFAHPDWLGEGGALPEDPCFAAQWHHARIASLQAWEVTRGSSEVVVAVLDTGIDPEHPDFKGRIFLEQAYDYINNDPDPTADHNHGIATAGLLGASANLVGGIGVDPTARILPIKVLDKNNAGNEWSLVQGIVHAADPLRGRARVISMSLVNYAGTEALQEALRYAREKGSVLVACAGNKGSGDADISWPGASPLCITVGSTNAEDRRSSTSGTGLALDVVAPGSQLFTTSPDRLALDCNIFSGCSAATPLVAGIAALLISRDPDLTADEVQELIQNGAEDRVGGPDDKKGWDEGYGWGRVNARASLDLIGPRFLRGDSNSDSSIDISDPITLLFGLFGGGVPLLCPDGGDANDDGVLDVADATSILNVLFLGGTVPRCTFDFTPDSLDCLRECQ